MDILGLMMIRRAREQRRQRQARALLRELRNSYNPLEDLSDRDFKLLFRLTKPLCRTFLDHILPFMEERQRETGLTKEQRVFCAIRFFAVGSYQRPIGQETRICLSQASVSRCVSEVSDIIDEFLAPQFISFPATETEKDEIKQEFYERFGIPGIIGLIDGTHILIKRPPNNIEHAYYAVRKSSHSKNVQIISGANLKILNVNAAFGGAAHDSFVFKSSSVSTFLKDNYFRGDRSSWILGDSGYPQLPWLMTPLSNTHNAAEERYNIVHKRTRSVIERCIGVLKSRFRCLSKQRILMYSPKRAGAIINSCCTLHNIMVQQYYPLPSEDDIMLEIQEDQQEYFEDQHNETSTLLQQGRRQREHLIRSVF
ncbi:putative nuclease HARBI1 [Phlebotomus papatasi]|uniref:putative nuclease HARBI1 n=1 Tax=Phlebotomus papatasi TaxID=29031 RepID=UPI0024835C71|nr:putative nuclease HARBI1 [Phlebotomus papatasi]